MSVKCIKILWIANCTSFLIQYKHKIGQQKLLYVYDIKGKLILFYKAFQFKKINNSIFMRNNFEDWTNDTFTLEFGRS